ncbi:MAG: nucleotide exchange factor GrpE [Christensenellaceae bacterium]
MAEKKKQTKKVEEVEKVEKAEDEQVIENVDEQKTADVDEEQESLDATDVNEMICAIEAEKEEYLNALVRERADFENYKKRNADLSAVSFQNGVADTVMAILPVIDNFERALAVESTDKAFYDGICMIMRQLQEELKSLGVEEIGAPGQFNPQYHNAVVQVEQEGYATNDVIEILQKGYLLNGRILRHAMVKVAK